MMRRQTIWQIQRHLQDMWLAELSTLESQMEAEDMAQEVLSMCREATKETKPLIDDGDCK